MDTSTPSAVDRASEDIWRLIFLELYQLANATDDQPKALHEEYVAVICSVCRFWLNIACNTSALWHVITFGGESSLPLHNSVERFGASFERSGVRNVKVMIRPCQEKPRAPLADLMSLVMPHLHRLDVLCVDRLPSQSTRSRTFLRSAEALHLLSPNGSSADSLIVLRLQNAFFQSPEHAILLLRKCPKLLDLCILCDSKWTTSIAELGDVPSEREPINLPALQCAGFEITFLAHLLTAGLTLPILFRLIVCNRDHVDPRSLVTDWSFAASLMSLSLVGWFDDVAVLQILTKTPDLHELSLEGCQGGDILLSVGLLLIVPWRTDPAYACMTPYLNYFRIMGGEVTDETVISLMDHRVPGPAGWPSKIRFDIRECPRTTSRLGDELRQRKRGVWVPCPATETSSSNITESRTLPGIGGLPILYAR